MNELTEKELIKVFEYLDELRESGVTNMYGAGSYISGAFNWDKYKSRAALSAWMKSFSKESVEVRAKKAVITV